jgi:hypothetical protein
MTDTLVRPLDVPPGGLDTGPVMVATATRIASSAW